MPNAFKINVATPILQYLLRQRPGQVPAGDRCSSRATSSGVPWATTRPPCVRRAGAEIDDVVGGLASVADCARRRSANARRASSASKQSSSCTTSEKCRPVVGSSSRNSVRPRRVRRHVAGQLQPLRLAARERVGRLAEPQIVEPHVDQPLEPGLHLRLAAEEA